MIKNQKGYSTNEFLALIVCLMIASVIGLFVYVVVRAVLNLF